MWIIKCKNFEVIRDFHHTNIVQKLTQKMPYQLCPYLDGFVVWVLLLVELGGREVDRLIVLQLDCLVFKGTMSFFQNFDFVALPPQNYHFFTSSLSYPSMSLKYLGTR